MTTRFEDALIRKTYTIYRLWHPETPGIRYVGMTTRALPARLYAHVGEAISFSQWATHKGNDHKDGKKSQWIRSLLEQGLAPHIDILETFYGTFKEARAIEDSWMMHYLGGFGNHSFTLLNAKQPKQAQTLVERKERSSGLATLHYENNKQTFHTTWKRAYSGEPSFDELIDDLEDADYIPPKFQLCGPISYDSHGNHITITNRSCDAREKQT